MSDFGDMATDREQLFQQVSQERATQDVVVTHLFRAAQWHENFIHYHGYEPEERIYRALQDSYPPCIADVLVVVVPATADVFLPGECMMSSVLEPVEVALVITNSLSIVYNECFNRREKMTEMLSQWGHQPNADLPQMWITFDSPIAQMAYDRQQIEFQDEVNA